MLLRSKLHVLMYPESTGTPSGSSAPAAPAPADGESRLPPGSDIPSERNDGRSDDTPSDEINWESESDRTPDDEGPGAPEGEEPAAPAPKPKEPAEEPAPAAAKPGEKPAGGEEPAAGEPQPGEGEQPAPAAQETPEQKTAREAKEAEERQKFEQELVEYYKIPDDLAARLATEPETVLPVLAAKVHQAVLKGLQQWVSQTVPQMMQSHSSVNERNARSKAAFYAEWPGLQKYEKQVLEVAQMFRRMNPKAPTEDSIVRIGELACAALKLDPGQYRKAGASAGPGGQPPGRPRAPARPAAPGGSSAGAMPASGNPWSEYADQLLEEDQQE